MSIARFIDPKNDFAFKQIFGTEKNKDILIHFLNDIIGYPDGQQITDVTFLETAQDPEIAAYRQSIVDVLCKTQDNTQIIIEMQVSKHKGFEQRAQYYAARAYSQQLLEEDGEHKKLDVYAKLKGVIFLAIADFTMFPDKSEWVSTHQTRDIKSNDHDLRAFHFIFLELTKFKKAIDQLENIQEKWAYFFKHAEHSTLDDIKHLIGTDIIMQRAFDAINKAGWTVDELRTYDHIAKANLDNQVIEEQKIEDAKAEGKIEGKTEEKIEIAKKLIQLGISIQDILSATSLTKKQVEELLK